MKRWSFLIIALVYLALVGIVLYSDIKDFLWTHPWWHSFLVALPDVAVPILAYVEVRHSAEANTLRSQGNEHLEQIARNVKQPITWTERNARTLRQHLRACVMVSEGNGSWVGTPEIVDVSEDNILTLFTPSSYSSSHAWSQQIECGDLEITKTPSGSCRLRLKVTKRYGNPVQLGEITRWEDRATPAATPTFAKGGMAYHAEYSKPGSSETRTLRLYASNDGANSFLLETTKGDTFVADNREISKRFMVLHVDYLAEGFERRGSGTGANPHRLFVC
jgi:hypothetical protein